MLPGRSCRSGVIADATLVVGMAALLGLTARAVAVSWGGSAWVPGAAVDAVVGACALLRGRRLRWATSVGLVTAVVATCSAPALDWPSQPGPAAALGLAVLIGSSVRSSPPREALGTAVAGLAVVLLTSLARLAFGAWPQGDLAVVPAVTVLNLAGWAAGAAGGLALRASQTRRRTGLAEARQHERTLLALELHDTAAHHLTAIVLQAQAGRVLLRRGGATAAPAVDTTLGAIEAESASGLATVRRMVELLRDPAARPPAPEPLAVTVQRLVDSFNARHAGAPARLELLAELCTARPAEAGWSAELGTTAARVVQEALTNVSRHDPNARSVTVRVDDHDGSGPVVVEIANRAGGQRRARRAPGGFGLVGMRERVEAVGGQLSAGPVGDGWLVRVVLPLRPQLRRTTSA